jgi:stearoyl-CoA desaturase (delta-9 desaturase)
MFAPGKQPRHEQVLVYLFVAGPTLALAAGVWFLGISWLNLALFFVMYYVTCLGVSAGYHRHFTHGSFEAKRWLRIVLAIAGGSMAVQGPVFHWVAGHRRHHMFSDKEGDPHSPWLFGTGSIALARGHSK